VKPVQELALAEGIVDIAQRQIVIHRARRVNSIKVLIGDAVAVEPSSLRFGFEVMAASIPQLKSAVLEIQSVPHCGKCRECEAEFAILDYDARCPTCGAIAVDVISGTEFQVLEMDIDDE
jgi:hydrogenase nickel incorporation protein HypA/HybF